MEQKDKPDFKITRGDAFDEDFSHYHNEKRFENFKKMMRIRAYTVGDSDVSYRLINHWGQKGLLPDGVRGNQGEWRKFTFVEMLWMRVVSHIREFGLSLEKIALIKNGIMEWDARDDIYFMLEYYIAIARTSTNDPYIIIWADGKADIATRHEMEVSKMFFGDEDRLLIPIKPIITKMGLQAYDSDFPSSLSKDEKELLKEVRFGENKEVKARINNNEITEIETIESHSDMSKLKDVEKTLEKERGFASINTKVTDGNKRSFEVVKRKRIGHQSP